MKKHSLIAAYFELTKPRILTMVLVTTVLGFHLGGKGMASSSLFLFLLFGVALVSAGASALNHYLEREFDSKMLRTRNRPVPAGIIAPQDALNFGIILTALGIVILYAKVNILVAFLSLVTAFLYIMVYTPMKHVSWLNTTIGAIPGAIPPLGGWAAATGGLSFEAGVLFFILFLWQHPHFYAIAWILRDDYKRGGFKMLPVIEPDGRRMFDQILWYSFILIPVSLLPAIMGMSGAIYFMGALISGVALFIVGRKLSDSKSVMDAKKLLRATVIYLPALLALIIIDGLF
jgi:protoheme IX farnesyltransferase